MDIDQPAQAQVRHCSRSLTPVDIGCLISDHHEDSSQPAKRQHPRRGRKTSRALRRAKAKGKDKGKDKGKGKGKETQTDVVPTTLPSEPSTEIRIKLILPPQYKSAVDWIAPNMKKEEYILLRMLAPDYICNLPDRTPHGTGDTWAEMWDWVSAYIFFLFLDCPIPVLQD